MDSHNIKDAFQKVKKDIMEIKDQLLTIAERQERLEASFEETKKKEQELIQIRTSKKSKEIKSKK
jgi:queuine/archaeosine tRNA-ribosyltransferase